MATGMGVYEKAIAPVKQDLFQGLFEDAQGPRVQRVLEVGMGTGPNCGYLAAAARAARQELEVVGVDPNPAMHSYARQAAADASLQPPTLVTGVAEALPVASSSCDAVVCTLVLCSVADARQAVAEAARVLKPGGKLLFIEHVAAAWDKQPLVRAQQAILEPLQQVLADGCHLTRDTLAVMEAARPSFSSLTATQANIPGLGILAPHIFGIGVKL